MRERRSELQRKAEKALREKRDFDEFGGSDFFEEQKTVKIIDIIEFKESQRIVAEYQNIRYLLPGHKDLELQLLEKIRDGYTVFKIKKKGKEGRTYQYEVKKA